MKNITGFLKTLTVIAIYTILLYSGVCFVGGSWNPLEWHWFWRFMVSVPTLGLAFLLLLKYFPNNGN